MLDMNNTTTVASYVFGDELICGTYGYYNYNTHGDVTSLADASGNITKDYEYDAFGTEKDADQTDNPYAYFDGETWRLAETKENNPRYMKAVRESAKYLKLFAKKKVKRYRLKNFKLDN